MGNTTTSRLNQEQAAAALKVTVKTLRTWEGKPWFPKGGRTKSGYDVAAIAATRPKSERATEQETPLRAKAREAEHVRTIEEAKRANVRRETDELKLRTAQGELIPRVGVELSFSDLLTGIADWCEQLPDLYVTMLPIPKKYHKPCRRLLKELIEQKQRELADELRSKALARDRP